MKIGLRKTNYGRRATTKFLNSTIGITPNKIKRSMKKSINPIYGTKTSGWLKPKKKIYNKLYKKTTISLFDEFWK